LDQTAGIWLGCDAIHDLALSLGDEGSPVWDMAYKVVSASGQRRRYIKVPGRNKDDNEATRYGTRGVGGNVAACWLVVVIWAIGRDMNGAGSGRWNVPAGGRV